MLKNKKMTSQIQNTWVRCYNNYNNNKCNNNNQWLIHNKVLSNNNNLEILCNQCLIQL